VGPQKTLFAAGKLADGPNQSVQLRGVLHATWIATSYAQLPSKVRVWRESTHTNRTFIAGTISVRRDRNVDSDVVCAAFAFELGASLNHVLYSAVGMPLDNRLHPEQGLQLSQDRSVLFSQSAKGARQQPDC
jgi:hypothetical protein